MASAKCGGTNIDYDEKLCTYTCACVPNQACVWSVIVRMVAAGELGRT
jgi:hypothetical protein